MRQAPQNFFYAGTYLGAVKDSSFFPSFLLLDMMAKSNANKVVVDGKTAWLFICGRDIFRKGIISADRLETGSYVLIINENNECLGFGKVTPDLAEETDANAVAVKNILDIGDFLRREKRRQGTKRSHDSKNRKGVLKTR